VEVGAEVFLVQEKEDGYLQNYLWVKLENPSGMVMGQWGLASVTVAKCAEDGFMNVQFH
jgi:hypothetical protein